jgi:transaldolase
MENTMNGLNKLFLDSASISDAELCIKRGLINGVTTNPSLFSKQPKCDFTEHCKSLADVCDGLPLSVEVFCADPNEMYDSALKLIDTIDYENLNVKVPVGFDELLAVKKLSARGVDVNVTCCFTLEQMMLAAKSGARYVSLFYNRAKDCGLDVTQILQDFNSFLYSTDLSCTVETISGSIRKPADVTAAWQAGSHIVTASTEIIQQMTQHEGTTKSTDQFLKDFDEWLK